MGKANQAKRRAKKAAKRRQQRARSRLGASPAPPALDLPRLEEFGAFAAEDVRAQLELHDDALSATKTFPERFLQRFDDGLILSEGGPVLAGTGVRFYDLWELGAEDAKPLSGYIALGTPCWSEAIRAIRRDVRRALSPRWRTALPAMEGPEGWLGLWSVALETPKEPPSYVDWLAPARPSAGHDAAGTLAQAAAAVWRGQREPRIEHPPVFPSVFHPAWEEPQKEPVRHFVGWRVRRGGAVVFYTLLIVTEEQLTALARGFLDAVERGHVETSADWDGLLLMAAVANWRARSARESSWQHVYPDPDLVPALSSAWARAGVAPLQGWATFRFLLHAMYLYEVDGLHDQDVPGLAFELLSLMIDEPPGPGRVPRGWGPLALLQTELLLLPTRLARAGGDSRADRLRAVEGVLDSVRRAIHLAIFPYLKVPRGGDALRKMLPRRRFDLFFDTGLNAACVEPRDEALHARPLAWLGLRADHPAARALGAGATVGAAARWAARQEAAAGGEDAPDAARGAAAEVREAIGTVRAEERLCALLGPPPFESSDPALPPLRWMLTLWLGWRGVFDPRARAAPVASLALPNRVRARIVRALSQAGFGGEAPLTVADIPGDLGALWAIRGVGRKSVEVLLQALWEHARSWRQALVPEEAARAVARVPEPARQEARANLSDGLDALADLFGGGGIDQHGVVKDDED